MTEFVVTVHEVTISTYIVEADDEAAVRAQYGHDEEDWDNIDHQVPERNLLGIETKGAS